VSAGSGHPSSGGRRIVLHIGLHKTGTTTIQNVLHADRDLLLREEGVLYPSLAPNLSTPLGTIFRDEPHKQAANRMAGLTNEEVAARREGYLSSLEDEVSRGGWEALLLSAEGVSTNLSEPELARLRGWGERYADAWTVLAWVRHPVDWARSVVQQRLKAGEDTLQKMYQDPPGPNYRFRISKFISVFGRENVRVFDYGAATASPGGILGAFAEQAGLSASTRDLLTSRTERHNESLSMEAVRILDSLNRQRPAFVGDERAPGRSGPGRELAYLSRIKGRRFDLPGAVKEEIRSRSREDVAWLNEAFGLDLYRDVLEPAPPAGDGGPAEPGVAPGDPAIDGVAEIIGELVAERAFERALQQGKAALEQGKWERAAGKLREASRLDPEAPQPKRLLRQLSRKRRKEGRADVERDNAGRG
jgi:hypothetical protein